jgi:glycine/D-amino acid oxidase-like deaminating enzyme
MQQAPVMTSVTQSAREVPVLARAQVVILGGGPSGVAAAVAAARQGASTLLVERYGFLGGMGTAAGVTSFCGLYANVHGRIEQVVHGVVDEVLARLEHMNALAQPHSIFGKTAARAYDNAAYKCVLDELVLGSGAKVLLHAYAADVVTSADAITALVVETKSGRGAILGDVFVDASGDADLCARAGCAFDFGDASGAVAYPTLMFRMGHVDTARALAEGKPRLRELMATAEATGAYRFPRRSAFINPQPHDGEWRANVTYIARPDGRAVDATNAEELSAGELDGRRQVLAFFRFLREYVPGFERAYLLEIAPQVGVRETRRVRGVYRLTAEDVLGCVDFADGIGVNGWPMEKHGGGEVEWRFLEGRGYHHLPYRMLLPAARARNVLVVGRCASATHEAQGSIRVSGPCYVMGEAAGTAAAMAVSAGLEPAGVDVEELRRRLASAGAFLGDAAATGTR